MRRALAAGAGEAGGADNRSISTNNRANGKTPGNEAGQNGKAPKTDMKKPPETCNSSIYIENIL